MSATAASAYENEMEDVVDDDPEEEEDASPKKGSKKILENALEGKFCYDDEIKARELVKKASPLVAGGLRCYKIENFQDMKIPVFVLERSAISAIGRLYDERFLNKITVTNIEGGRGKRDVTQEDVVQFASTMSAEDRQKLLEQLLNMK